MKLTDKASYYLLILAYGLLMTLLPSIYFLQLRPTVAIDVIIFILVITMLGRKGELI